MTGANKIDGEERLRATLAKFPAAHQATFLKSSIVRRTLREILDNRLHIQKSLRSTFQFSLTHTVGDKFLTCMECEKEGPVVAVADTLTHTQHMDFRVNVLRTYGTTL